MSEENLNEQYMVQGVGDTMDRDEFESEVQPLH